MSGTIRVRERGAVLAFSYDDMLRYHGGLAPGGVAHGFKVMERAFPRLAPDGVPERRELRIETAFPGPGARDAFEAATRCVSDGRFRVDPALVRPEHAGTTRARYVFRLSCGGASVAVQIRDGMVRQEYLDLSARGPATPAEAERLEWLKHEMAERLMSLPADAVYDLCPEPGR